MCYEALITAATKITDSADFAAILDEMYNVHHTLNNLSLAKFNSEARKAWKFILFCRSPEGIAMEAALEAEMMNA